MLEGYWSEAPFSTPPETRKAMQLETFATLTRHHASHCPAYANILNAFYGGIPEIAVVEDIPYLPVPLFKTLDLLSVPQQDIVRTMASSGTSGRPVSRVHLDAATAKNQARTLVQISQEILGPSRLPLIVVDQRKTIKDRASFNARTAAIIGFSTLGRAPFFLLDDETMRPDWAGLQEYLQRHDGSPALVFGFTFMVWQHFVEAAAADGVKLDLADGILLHGGGWKNLTDRSIDNTAFKNNVRERFGIDRVHNYYGMVEQTGSIFVECAEGHLHASVFSDVIVRDPATLAPLPPGEEGILQVLSALPESYPGHSLLTEDRGTLLGEDDCPCGWTGRYFHVHGRLPAAELRGCSDVRKAA